MANGEPNPSVSVVMSVFNGERYLADAVRSILRQTLTNLEFIIVDDGSTDDTRAILDGFSDRRIVRIHHDRNRGMGEAYNRAFRQARGEFIAMQDADDVSLPQRLMSEVTFLRQHPDVGIVATAIYETNANGERVHFAKPPASDTAIRWHMLFITPLCHGSMMFRRHLLEGDGPYYEVPAPVEDYAFFTKLLRRTRAAGLSEPLYLYRRHDSNTSQKLSGEAAAAVGRISARQIGELLPDTPWDLPRLGELQRCLFPVEVRASQAATYATILRLFAAFERRPETDDAVVRDLRRDWVRRVLARVQIREWREIWNSGILQGVLREDPGAIGATIPRELYRRVQLRMRRLRRSGR